MISIFFSVGLSVFVFQVSPYLPKSLNIICALFPTMIPMLFTLFTNEHKYRSKWTIFTFINNKLDNHRKISTIIKVILIISGISCYCISIIYTVITIIYLKLPSHNMSNGLVAGCLVLCCFLCSIPYWMNFAVVSVSRTLRELSFHVRGYRHIEGIINHKHLKADGVAWANMLAGMVEIHHLIELYLEGFMLVRDISGLAKPIIPRNILF